MTASKSPFLALAAVVGLSFGNPATHADKSQADIVRGVLPSVVNLTVLKSDGSQDAQGQYYGSGFVVDRSGLILTNRHVVEGAETISVTFADGRMRAARCAPCPARSIWRWSRCRAGPTWFRHAGATATGCTWAIA